MNKWVFLNNEFIEEEQAALHVSDLAIQRGYGIFDFFKVVDNIPLFLDDHLERFYYSVQKMRLTINQQPGELKDIIYTLIKKNNIPHAGIRITVTGGYSLDGYQLTNPNLIISQQPVQIASIQAQKGIKLITYEYQRDLPDVKTINYAMAIWLQPFIKERGADDVFYFKGWFTNW